jgi:hypothetical protein
VSSIFEHGKAIDLRRRVMVECHLNSSPIPLEPDLGTAISRMINDVECYPMYDIDSR